MVVRHQYLLVLCYVPFFFARVLDVLREKQTRSMVSRDVAALDMKRLECSTRLLVFSVGFSFGFPKP